MTILDGLPPPATPAATLLQQHVDAGAAAAQAGRQDEAAARFGAAFALSDAPALLFNGAQVRRKAGALDEARCLYRRFLAAAPADPLRSEAEGHLAAMGEEAKRAEARTIGGAGPDRASAVAVGADGAVVLAGSITGVVPFDDGMRGTAGQPSAFVLWLPPAP